MPASGTHSLHAGQLIAGRYRLIRPLDSGAMGDIWVADEQGKRQTAIKVLKSAHQSAGMRERFDREIGIVAKLRSPYTVRVFQWGELEDGTPYMVMELLRGSNLCDLLKTRTRLDTATAVDFAVQACAALVEAHAHGVIHRDLKPANLFLSENRIHVLDFGIAKATEDDRAQTKDGEYVGTLLYSAPEHLLNARTVSTRSDIWSIGAVLFELITGEPPFDEDNLAALVDSIVHKDFSRPAVLRAQPPTLQDCIARCLAKRADDRWSSAAELILALAPFGGPTAQAIAHAVIMEEATIPSLPPGALRSSLPDPASEATTGHGAPEPAAVATRDDDTAVDHDAPTVIPSAGGPLFAEDQLFSFLASPKGPAGNRRSIIFMLGSGFSLPRPPTNKGVPGTGEIVNRLKLALPEEERATLDEKLSESADHYQTAFSYLASVDTPEAAKHVIRRAVLEARKSAVADSSSVSNDDCKRYEEERHAWGMPEGCKELGALIASGLGLGDTEPERPDNARFSRLHLTTNFDPLLRISVRRHGRVADAVVIDHDLAIPPFDPQLCRVVHLHGRWDHGDMLNMGLDDARPALEFSLRELLRSNTLVVLGYGGWEDVFMRTLDRVAPFEEVDIRWAFWEAKPADLNAGTRKRVLRLKEKLGQRMQLYYGVDVNRLFPRLRQQLAPPSTGLPRADLASAPSPPPQPHISSPIPVPIGWPPAHYRRPLLLMGLGLAVIGLFLAGNKFFGETTQTHVCVKIAGECSQISDTLKIAVDQGPRPCTVSALDDACCAQVECQSLQGLKVKVHGPVKQEQWASAGTDPINVQLHWPPVVNVTGCPLHASAGDPRLPSELMIAPTPESAFQPVSLSSECRLESKALAAALPDAVSHFTVGLDDPFYAVAATDVAVQEGVANVTLTRKPELVPPVEQPAPPVQVNAGAAGSSAIKPQAKPPCPPACITQCETHAAAAVTGTFEQWFNDCLRRKSECRRCPTR